MTPFETFMQRHVKDTVDDFIKKGEAAPVWILEDYNGMRILLMTPWSNSNEKHTIEGMIRRTLNDKNIARYAFAMESWFAVEPDMTTRIEDAVPPSQRPDRREGVFISGEDRNGEHQTVMYEIKRTGDKPELVLMDGADAVYGRFVNMFGD